MWVFVDLSLTSIDRIPDALKKLGASIGTGIASVFSSGLRRSASKSVRKVPYSRNPSGSGEVRLLAPMPPPGRPALPLFPPSSLRLIREVMETRMTLKMLKRRGRLTTKRTRSKPNHTVLMMTSSLYRSNSLARLQRAPSLLNLVPLNNWTYHPFTITMRRPHSST